MEARVKRPSLTPARYVPRQTRTRHWKQTRPFAIALLCVLAFSCAVVGLSRPEAVRVGQDMVNP